MASGTILRPSSGDTLGGHKVLIKQQTFTWSNSVTSNSVDISTATGGVVTSSNIVLVVGNGAGGLLVIATDGAKQNMFCALVNRTAGFTGNINVMLLFLYD